jgi:hypothetical protein
MFPLRQALQSLSYLSVRLVLRGLTPLRLPRFKGSTLRGGFGHAFKEAVCVVEHRDCARCLLWTRCAYPYVFDTSVPGGAMRMRKYTQGPHPFIPLPSSGGKTQHQRCPSVTTLDGGSVLTYAAIIAPCGTSTCNSSWTSLARLLVVPTGCTALVNL